MGNIGGLQSVSSWKLIVWRSSVRFASRQVWEKASSRGGSRVEAITGKLRMPECSFCNHRPLRITLGLSQSSHGPKFSGSLATFPIYVYSTRPSRVRPISCLVLVRHGERPFAGGQLSEILSFFPTPTSSFRSGSIRRPGYIVCAMVGSSALASSGETNSLADFGKSVAGSNG